MNSQDRPISRRVLLRGGIVGLVVLAGGEELLLAGGEESLLAGCSKKGSDAPFACTETAGMEPDAVQARTVVGYTDAAPDLEKTCGGCQQYVAAPNDGACGSCKVVKGPIHPNGWCKAFTAKS